MELDDTTVEAIAAEDSLISGHAGGTGGDKPMARLLMVVYVPLDGFDPPDLLPLDPDLASDTAHDFVDMINEAREDGPFSDIEVCGLPAPQWVSVADLRNILRPAAALPDPRPTEAEAYDGYRGEVPVIGWDMWEYLRELGCFRPEEPR